MSQGISRLIVLGVTALTLALPASAMAQSPHSEAYDDPSIAVVSDSDATGDSTGTGGVPASGTTTDSGETLPFSGLDILLLGAMGGSLVLLGFGMRRLTRRPDTA
jgi:hypothetical protein